MSITSAPLYMFRFNVRVPIHQTNTFIWTKQTAFGIDEDDAAREIIERIPDANELAGLPAGDPVYSVICGKRKIDQTGADERAWCTACGQNWEHHPITTHSKQAHEARDWMDTLEQEGIAHFI